MPNQSQFAEKKKYHYSLGVRPNVQVVHIEPVRHHNTKTWNIVEWDVATKNLSVPECDMTLHPPLCPRLCLAFYVGNREELTIYRY